MPRALDKKTLARLLGPGLAAVLAFNARRLYGRELEELGLAELCDLVRRVLGGRAGPVLRVLEDLASRLPGGQPGGAPVFRMFAYA